MAPSDTSTIHFDVTQGSNAPHRLVGVYYLSHAEQPAPLALLLHGIPGAEKNHDLAHHLRAKGWHVLVPNFSGTWGSGGDYNIKGQVDDAIAALDFALSDDAPAEIDPVRVAAIGFSLGSRAALHATARDERIKAVVSLAGFCDFEDMLINPDFMEAWYPYLSGMTAQSLDAQWMALGDGMQPIEALAKVTPRPALIVHGTQDEIVPYFHADGFMMGAGDHVQRVTIEGSNHVFGDYRQLTVVIRLPAIDPVGLTSTGKLNYHISVCRYAALRAGGKGRSLLLSRVTLRATPRPTGGGNPRYHHLTLRV